jgi:hypothetical protein
MRFKYQCPDCLSTNNLHERGCDYEDLDRANYEKAYIDILSVLSEVTCSKQSLINNAHQWSDLHDDVLARLEAIGHVEQTSDGYYKMVPPGERRSGTEPYIDPLATIYRHGTVPGCHDDGLFALMAFYSHAGLSWEDTKKELLDWYERTGAWERGGFEEEAPEALIEKKKHIWDTGYGWEQKGRQAKKVIERTRSTASSARSPNQDNGGTV